MVWMYSTNVRISWEVQSTAWPYAEPVSHEIEAAAPQCLHTVKLAARSETTDARLQGLKPGTLYQVCHRFVRCHIDASNGIPSPP